MSTDQPTLESTARQPGRPRVISDDAIYLAGLQVLAEHGSKGLTLARMARVLGVTPAAVRQRFGSKRGLLVEMARRRIDQVQGRFATARAAHDSPLEALQAAIVAGLDQISDSKQLANAMSVYTDNVDIDEMREAFATELAVMELQVTELLTLAVEAGEVGGPVTPELVSSVLVAVEGTMFIWALVPRGDLEERIHQAVNGALGKAAEGAG